MQDSEELEKLIFQSEFLMEGLDKGFWRFVKLSEPQIWNNIEGDEAEYVWVIAVMGNYCIVRDVIDNDFFRIACYDTHGEIDRYLSYQGELHNLVPEIVNSRYVIS